MSRKASRPGRPPASHVGRGEALILLIAVIAAPPVGRVVAEAASEEEEQVEGAHVGRGEEAGEGAVGQAVDEVKSGDRIVGLIGDEPGDEEIGIEGAAGQRDVEAAGNGDAGQPEGGALVEGGREHGTDRRGVGDVGVEPGGSAGGEGGVEGGGGGEGRDGQEARLSHGRLAGARLGRGDGGRWAVGTDGNCMDTPPGGGCCRGWRGPWPAGRWARWVPHEYCTIEHTFVSRKKCGMRGRCGGRGVVI